jgi:hypothetical protein
MQEMRMTSPFKKMMMIVAAIIALVAVVVVAAPRVKQAADRNVATMLEREADINRVDYSAAEKSCTIENGCVGKGDPGKYPDGSMLNQPRPAVAQALLANQPGPIRSNDGERNRVLAVGFLLFVLGPVTIGALIWFSNRP